MAKQDETELRETGTEVIVACKTLRTEIEHLMHVHGVERRVIWLDHLLHNVPKQLTATLQETLDGIEGADRVFLGYGNCGNAIQGLIAGDFELIVPRVDDCISLVMGSQRYREQFTKEHRAFYLTDGWAHDERTIDGEYAKLCETYGQEEADEIISMMYAHYETLAYLDTGLYDIDALMAETHQLCEVIEAQQMVEPATLSYLEALVCGPWPEHLFVHVPAHTAVPATPFFEPGSTRPE